jgi:hypothetical protein
MRNVVLALTVMLTLTLTLAGCFPGSERYTPETPAGFFTGIWHGWIAPLSLIVGIFDHCVRIYEVYNTGWWYDFGFYIAVIAGFGGLALSRRRTKSSPEAH